MATTKKSSRKANMKPGDVIVTPTGAYEVNKDGRPIKLSEANRERANRPGAPAGNYQRAVQIDLRNKQRKKEEREKMVKKIKAAAKPRKASRSALKRKPR